MFHSVAPLLFCSFAHVHDGPELYCNAIVQLHLVLGVFGDSLAYLTNAGSMCMPVSWSVYQIAIRNNAHKTLTVGMRHPHQ